ncbi:MAG: hypothetical protein GY811_28835 [Myxococcales bacterium]|nr:hypothetical protein [Myxococcales bacterium]
MGDEDNQGKHEQAETGDESLDANVELFSEYYEGNLAPKEAAELEALLASDEKARQDFADFEKTMEMLSGMHKMSAPMDFDKRVEDTIRRRSGGRFFGKRAFGERIPYEALAILVMIIAGIVYWMGRSSATGSHKLDNDSKPEIHDGARDVVPRLK